MTAFCVSSLGLTTAPWHRSWEALCADIKGKSQEKRSGSSLKDTWPGAVEPGSNSSLPDHKGIPFWHVNSEATEERAHVDPEGICWFCFSHLWSTLDFAWPSFRAVEGHCWSWVAQLRLGLSGSWKKENLICKQYLSFMWAYISSTPANFRVPEGKGRAFTHFTLPHNASDVGI